MDEQNARGPEAAPNAEEICTRLRDLLTRAGIRLPALGVGRGGPAAALHLGECDLDAAQKLIGFLLGTEVAAPAVETLVMDEPTRTLGVVTEHVASFVAALPRRQGRPLAGGAGWAASGRVT